MLLHIKRILDTDQVASLARHLGHAAFVDGRLSAGSAAARVKNNQELDREDPLRARLVEAALAALLADPRFLHAVHPARIGTPIFARYSQGMAYGEHVDDPLMGGPEVHLRYRSDLSYTLFLSEPADYDGGELVLLTPTGEQGFKASAGDLVLYPSSFRHRVAEVSAGTRLVMVGWLQSQVRSAERRTILYDLWQAREQLLSEAPEGIAGRAVDTSYINLLRMWAET